MAVDSRRRVGRGGDNNGLVPKITAATVAEHRVAQRAALIAAAKIIIAAEGVAGISARTVCERAGLARSSFYEYFPSKDDLLAAIAAEAFSDWARELEAAMAAAQPGRPRLHAYIEATIRMAADGKHTLATGLQHTDLSPKSHDDIMAMHDALTTPLRTLLHELEVQDAPTQAVLVQGIITAGMTLVDHGSSPADVTRLVTALLDDGLAR